MEKRVSVKKDDITIDRKNHWEEKLSRTASMLGVNTHRGKNTRVIQADV